LIGESRAAWVCPSSTLWWQSWKALFSLGRARLDPEPRQWWRFRSRQASFGRWERAFEIPAGEYEYKVAIDTSRRSTTALAVGQGAQYRLNLPTATSVTFLWDQVTHIVTRTLNN
jgi:hypothetical protein